MPKEVLDMPTNNPRITFTVSDELFKEIEEYRFGHRMKNQTQAIVSLINLGFAAMQGKPLEPECQFTEDEVELIELYRSAVSMARDIAENTLRSYPAAQKEHLA